jgi:transposase
VVVFIYSVAEIAHICGVSVQTIYKQIKSFTPEELNLYLNQVETKFKQITPEGLQYFKSIYCISEDKDDCSDTQYNTIHDTADENIILLLTEQLRIKDKQIEVLMEQNRNFQVLLKAEQDKLLPPVKETILERFLRRIRGDRQ